MNSYLLTISYDGSDYYGYGIQPNLRTIESTLIKAIKGAFNLKFTMTSASRTDRGVHSYGQRVKITINLELPCSKIIFILNNLLPGDIRIIACIKVASDFHVRKSCQQKTYHYLIRTGMPDAFQSRYCMFYKKQINLQQIQGIAKVFIGTFDFSKFASISNKSTINPIRTIDSIKIIQENELITFVIKGPSFLQHQIRIIIGTILACYEDRISLITIKEKLTQSNDASSPYKVIGNGLYLMQIDY